MKSVGIVRKLDHLGRVVLPKELRNTLGIEEGQSLEIYIEGETIMLKKYNPGCNCCGEIKIKATVQGIKLCEKCINDFNKAREEIDKLRG